MSADKLRLLADCLECGFMTDTDRMSWASDLRALAKNIDRTVNDARGETEEVPRG